MPNTRNQWVAYLAALSTDKRKLAHQRYKMSSERRQYFCKYWNLQTVVMSDCFIAARKSHAKHNKSVGILERGQTRLLNFSESTSGNKKKENVCWRGTYFLFRWKQSMDAKSHANKHKLVTFLIPEHGQRRAAHQRHKMSRERRQKTLQILELTNCSHCGLFVDSHPKFTCQTQ